MILTVMDPVEAADNSTNQLSSFNEVDGRINIFGYEGLPVNGQIG
jgi:hypothetical protein